MAPKPAGMAEPPPLAEPPADDAEPVIALNARMRLAPSRADHLAPARRREDARLRRRRELGKETCEIAGGADKACRRGERIGRRLARKDHTPPERQLAAVAARQLRPVRQRNIRRGLGQPRSVDDLALDPGAIALAGDRLDDEPGEAIAVIRIFEPRIRLDRGAGAEILADQFDGGKAPAGAPLTAIVAGARQAGAVPEQVRDGHVRHRLVQIADILPDRIVEPQPALLTQLHDPR